VGAASETYTVVAADVRRFAAGAQVAGGVSLLFADPPYRIDAAEVSHILEVLGASGAIGAGALVVYEHARDVTPTWPTGFVGEQERHYGDTGVSLARFEGGL
jgi:16S rRNA (guanine966-N2)-methyltransferase